MRQEQSLRKQGREYAQGDLDGPYSSYLRPYSRLKLFLCLALGCAFMGTAVFLSLESLASSQSQDDKSGKEQWAVSVTKEDNKHYREYLASTEESMRAWRKLEEQYLQSSIANAYGSKGHNLRDLDFVTAEEELHSLKSFDLIDPVSIRKINSSDFFQDYLRSPLSPKTAEEADFAKYGDIKPYQNMGKNPAIKKLWASKGSLHSDARGISSSHAFLAKDYTIAHKQVAYIGDTSSTQASSIRSSFDDQVLGFEEIDGYTVASIIDSREIRDFFFRNLISPDEVYKDAEPQETKNAVIMGNQIVDLVPTAESMHLTDEEAAQTKEAIVAAAAKVTEFNQSDDIADRLFPKNKGKISDSGDQENKSKVVGREAKIEPNLHQTIVSESELAALNEVPSEHFYETTTQKPVELNRQGKAPSEDDVRMIAPPPGSSSIVNGTAQFDATTQYYSEHPQLPAGIDASTINLNGAKEAAAANQAIGAQQNGESTLANNEGDTGSNQVGNEQEENDTSSEPHTVAAALLPVVSATTDNSNSSNTTLATVADAHDDGDDTAAATATPDSIVGNDGDALESAAIVTATPVSEGATASTAATAAATAATSTTDPNATITLSNPSELATLGGRTVDLPFKDDRLQPKLKEVPLPRDEHGLGAYIEQELSLGRDKDASTAQVSAGAAGKVESKASGDAESSSTLNGEVVDSVASTSAAAENTATVAANTSSATNENGAAPVVTGRISEHGAHKLDPLNLQDVLAYREQKKHELMQDYKYRHSQRFAHCPMGKQWRIAVLQLGTSYDYDEMFYQTLVGLIHKGLIDTSRIDYSRVLAMQERKNAQKSALEYIVSQRRDVFNAGMVDKLVPDGVLEPPAISVNMPYENSNYVKDDMLVRFSDQELGNSRFYPYSLFPLLQNPDMNGDHKITLDDFPKWSDLTRYGASNGYFIPPKLNFIYPNNYAYYVELTRDSCFSLQDDGYYFSQWDLDKHYQQLSTLSERAKKGEIDMILVFGLYDISWVHAQKFQIPVVVVGHDQDILYNHIVAACDPLYEQQLREQGLTPKSNNLSNSIKLGVHPQLYAKSTSYNDNKNDSAQPGRMIMRDIKDIELDQTTGMIKVTSPHWGEPDNLYTRFATCELAADENIETLSNAKILDCIEKADSAKDSEQNSAQNGQNGASAQNRGAAMSEAEASEAISLMGQGNIAALNRAQAQKLSMKNTRLSTVDLSENVLEYEMEEIEELPDPFDELTVKLQLTSDEENAKASELDAGEKSNAVDATTAAAAAPAEGNTLDSNEIIAQLEQDESTLNSKVIAGVNATYSDVNTNTYFGGNCMLNPMANKPAFTLYEFSPYPNIHVQLNPIRHFDDVEYYQHVFNIKRLGVIVDNSEIYPSLHSVKEIEDLMHSLGGSTLVCQSRFITPDTKAASRDFERCVAFLSKENVDGVYLMRNNGSAIHKLYYQLRPLLDKDIPVFSRSGRAEVKSGALMSMSYSYEQSFGRFESNVISQIMHGMDPTRISQYFFPRSLMTVNARIASDIGWIPDYADLLRIDVTYLDVVSR